MNRNPGRPKIMLPCTCESRYQECNCEWLRWHSAVMGMRKKRIAGHFYIPLMVLAVSVVLVGLNYLFRG